MGRRSSVTENFMDRNEAVLKPKPANSDRRVLLTGASGYVGGRLLPQLEALGVPVRCIARRPEFIEGRVGPQTEVVEGDVIAVLSNGGFGGIHGKLLEALGR